MAEGKKKVIVYAEWIDSFDELTDEEAGKLIKHFFKYINDLEPILEDRLLKMMWIPIQQALKRDLKKYHNIVERNKLNGSLGGRPKKNPENPVGYLVTQKNPEKPKKADNDNDNDNDNNIKKKIDKRKSEFFNSLPTTDDEVELLKFFDYWTEHGPKDRKMRFEKQITFDIKRRWSTWLNNSKKWEKEKSSGKKEKVNAGTLLKQKYGIQ